MERLMEATDGVGIHGRCKRRQKSQRISKNLRNSGPKESQILLENISIHLQSMGAFRNWNRILHPHRSVRAILHPSPPPLTLPGRKNIIKGLKIQKIGPVGISAMSWKGSKESSKKNPESAQQTQPSFSIAINQDGASLQRQSQQRERKRSSLGWSRVKEGRGGNEEEGRRRRRWRVSRCEGDWPLPCRCHEPMM